MRWTTRTATAVIFICAAGCSSYDSFCKDAIDCEGGNDQDEEACVISLDAEEEIADIQGCSDDYAELFDCVEENSHCTGDNRWTDEDKCKEKQDKLNRCRG